MGKLILALAVIAAAVLGGGYFNRTHCLNDIGPRTTVQNYLAAMKAERFEDAYQFVTTSMTDDQPVAEWAEEQRLMFKMAKVVINEIDVRRGYRDLKNVFICAATAKVSNVLHASDILNNQGSSEFEVYTVVMDGGVWKIESQETLFDDDLIRQWFPDEKMPVFKDTLAQPIPK